ncbi:hypothetical protein DE146DRAFT_452171 [Phaeosphaeria sp. MPI-PUGE-AT-0046c]|nr:hypothetical protein DE146DRAFT_452171 [Phaeosphaeria sp. MPI-PUGE-AT-0046c]
MSRTKSKTNISTAGTAAVCAATCNCSSCSDWSTQLLFCAHIDHQEDAPGESSPSQRSLFQWFVLKLFGFLILLQPQRPCRLHDLCFIGGFSAAHCGCYAGTLGLSGYNRPAPTMTCLVLKALSRASMTCSVKLQVPRLLTACTQSARRDQYCCIDRSMCRTTTRTKLPDMWSCFQTVAPFGIWSLKAYCSRERRCFLHPECTGSCGGRKGVQPAHQLVVGYVACAQSSIYSWDRLQPMPLTLLWP